MSWNKIDNHVTLTAIHGIHWNDILKLLMLKYRNFWYIKIFNWIELNFEINLNWKPYGYRITIIEFHTQHNAQNTHGNTIINWLI